MKLSRASDGILLFACPGCGDSHGVNADPKRNLPCWGWNGSLDAPTFSPSILVRGHDEKGDTCCHGFVRDGKIQYLADSTHALAGQTVEIPDWYSQ
jgi:hypothetical protein